jgi:hypothetical protein
MPQARLGRKHLALALRARTVALRRRAMAIDRHPPRFAPLETVDFEFVIGAHALGGRTYLALAVETAPHSPVWNVRTVTRVRVLPITPGGRDADLEGILLRGLALCTLYYSETHDLSLSAAKRAAGDPPRAHFTWNFFALENFGKLFGKDLGVARPVIAGFVGTFQKPDYSVLLISRRSPLRAGVRLWLRGADRQGYVANYVETEQVLVRGRTVFSWVQVRGSIPLIWSQYPDLARLPRIALGNREDGRAVFTAHFGWLNAEYGTPLVISMTDNRGRESEITRAYNRLGPEVPGGRFQYFDFHRECSRLRWGNLQRLLSAIQNDLDLIGRTEVCEDQIVERQSGVVRTNCVDCLDRTNVVQSLIAKRGLIAALGGNFDCDREFRALWADNADALSRQYAGTAALKTDYTRTGKRSVLGALADGVNAMRRWYINTVHDGTRQDAYDAVTQAVDCGKYVKGVGAWHVLLWMIWAFVLYAVLLVVKGKKIAQERVREVRAKAVNRPSFRAAELQAV